MPCVQELGHVLGGILAILPWDAVRRRSVKTRVGGEEPEGHPALVDFWRRMPLRCMYMSIETSREYEKTTSKPPISCDAKAKPDTVKDNAPRKASAIASHVDSQSPPQCTGNLEGRQHPFLHPNVRYLPLTTSRRRSREHHSLTSSKLLFEDVEDQLVVQNRVHVVYIHRIRAVVKDNPGMWNAFTEVGLSFSLVNRGWKQAGDIP